MMKFKPRKFAKPIINDKQKEQISDLLLKIVGDTIKGKLARLTLAGAVATGAQYIPDDPPKPSAAAKQVPAKK